MLGPVEDIEAGLEVVWVSFIIILEDESVSRPEEEIDPANSAMMREDVAVAVDGNGPGPCGMLQGEVDFRHEIGAVGVVVVKDVYAVN